MTEIARLSIRLDDVEPKVGRRIEVPLAIKLDDLHLVIQIVMGWENYHLYEFRVGRRLAWGVPDPDWPGDNPLSAERATLADLLERLAPVKTFHYVYDFGDDWRHTIKVQAIAAAESGIVYPRLLSAAGRCPPEDCGGPWGYDHYLAAIADPDHDDHQRMIDWRGPGFDPNAVDEPAIHKELARHFNRRRRRAKTAP